VADTYGALQVPVQLPVGSDAVSDPALTRLGEYLQIFLNTYAQAAFDKIGLPVGKNGRPPVVRTIWSHDPTEYVFSESHLPAMYITRTGGTKPVWRAEDYRISSDQWTIQWIFPPAQQANQRMRDSITNALVKYIDLAIEKVRDPAWAWALDPDPKAASVLAAPTAIKLSVASSTSTANYTGSALDGTVGASSFAPPRHPTVTVAGTAGAILAGSTVIVTGTGADDDATPRTSVITLSAAAGTYEGDWNLSSVTSIDVPAQLGTGATLTFGLAPYVGRGTSILNATGLMDLEVASWSDKMIAIKMSSGVDPRTYDAVEIKLMTEERWIQDTSLLDDQGLDVTIPYSDGTGVLERMTLS
jgi:hypothetical protein